MAEKERDPFPHLTKYKKLKKKADRIIETTDLHHREAYNSAVQKILMNEEGLVDYDKLDDNKTQLKFADAMSDYYLDKAKKYLKSKVSGKDEFENEMLRSAYAGVTKSVIKEMVGQHGNKFKWDTFNRHKKRFMERVGDTMHGAVRSHLKEEHIDDIIKYTKTEDVIDKNKIRLPEAIQLLDIYHEQGAITKEMVKGTLYAKKEHKKK
jgi:hypothetical protein